MCPMTTPDPSTGHLSDVQHLFTAIDHVGIAVPDLDEAMAFYRDAYGMAVLHEEVNEEQGVREAMVGVGDSGSCIQLLAPLTPESTIAKFLANNPAGGMHHVCYEVEDIIAARDKLKISPDVSVEGSVGIGPLPTGFGIEVQLNISLPGVPAEEAQALIDRAHIVCPYSNATRGNINVTLQLV